MSASLLRSALASKGQPVPPGSLPGALLRGMKAIPSFPRAGHRCWVMLVSQQPDRSPASHEAPKQWCSLLRNCRLWWQLPHHLLWSPPKALTAHFSAGEMACGYSSSVESPQPQSAGLTSNSALPYLCLQPHSPPRLLRKPCLVELASSETKLGCVESHHPSKGHAKVVLLGMVS